MADGLDFSSITKSDIGGLLGGLLGARQSGDSTQTQTANKDPWAAAQPWMKDNLAQGQQIQKYYQQNPFSEQQKTAYQNLFNGVDNFNQHTAPGLMAFANNGMNSSYQRQTGGAPGSVAGYGGEVQPGGVRNSGQAGAFSAAPSQAIGQVDWAKMNPYTNGGITAPVATANPISRPVVAPGLLGGGTTGSGGSGSGQNFSNNGFGSDTGSLGGLLGGFSTLDSTNSQKVGWGGEGQIAGGLIGGPIGAVLGKLIGANIQTDSYNGYGTLSKDGSSTPDPGPGWSDARDRYGLGPTSSPPTTADQNAAMAASLNGVGYGGGMGGLGGYGFGTGFGATGVGGLGTGAGGYGTGGTGD